MKCNSPQIEFIFSCWDTIKRDLCIVIFRPVGCQSWKVFGGVCPLSKLFPQQVLLVQKYDGGSILESVLKQHLQQHVTLVNPTLNTGYTFSHYNIGLRAQWCSLPVGILDASS